MSSWHSEEKSWKYFTFIIETMLSFDLLLFYTNTILCALLHKTGVNHFPPAVRSYWRMSNQSCQITKKCISRVKYPICYYIHVNFKICDSHIKINYTKNSKEISSTDKIFNFGSCDCSDFFVPILNVIIYSYAVSILILKLYSLCPSLVPELVTVMDCWGREFSLFQGKPLFQWRITCKCAYR